MENLYTLSPSVTSVQLQDAIYARIHKSKAILTCLMFVSSHTRRGDSVDHHAIYHVLWAADQYLEELESLFRLFSEHA